MKRCLILIFALLFAVLLPLSACKKAETPIEEKAESRGLTYLSAGNGTCSVTGIGVCTDTDVIVPATSPAGDRVTAVGREAFKDCNTLTGIVLPAGVESIGNRAFSGCSALKTVRIPDSITSLGLDVFEGCAALQYNGRGNAAYLGNAENPYLILFKAADPSITKCTVYEKTKIICASAFNGCQSLTAIVIPDSVVFIGNQAFAGTGLVSVSIPASVSKIDFGAFYECIHLTAVEIPSGITEIGVATFSYCTALSQITIPQGVQTIADRAFSNCIRLASVNLPKSVTSVGQSAFADCAFLKDIHYAGTQAEWGAVTLGTEWDGNMDSCVVHCTDGDITK